MLWSFLHWLWLHLDVMTGIIILWSWEETAWRQNWKRPCPWIILWDTANYQTKQKALWSLLTLVLLGSKLKFFLIVHTIWGRILHYTDDTKAHIMSHSVSSQHTSPPAQLSWPSLLPYESQNAVMSFWSFMCHILHWYHCSLIPRLAFSP